ncbi:MAG: hypothetical protein H7Y27_00030 [Gemmatimonadaceae bacterium]|nr:hypothetical protein [Chitinophagaceae bacterium]
MKKLYFILSLLMVSLAGLAQSYVYTAQKSGNWNDITVWNISLRNDNVPKSKVVIPASHTVTVDNAVNSFGLGDAEIKILGTLSVLPGTTVNLSASCSIELQGPGRITGSTNTQLIRIGGVVKYDGSIDQTKQGASYANQTTSFSPNGFFANTSLAVKFTSFTATKSASAIELKWITSSEISNDYFEIERSYNGSNWQNIGKINGTGTTSFASLYSFTDKNASGTVVYYRLKQVDIDGKSEYSIVKTVRGENTATARIYNSGSNVNVELNSSTAKSLTVTVMNANGQMIEKKDFTNGYKISMNMSGKASGILIVNISDNNQFNQTTRLFL